ncbi:hypothetical protein BJ508DRAFT_416480 [Ascobolus immersus RN42]|uniref:Uncharacterized protein n=1 Tax=Ascobolus immersus RN42 TaxID=1160509 RepID=A0A3N4HXN0_ASCIM|nr:hypothetical protein BJ508DRAFT_416480 [Ascobolus immersus RN42]
MPPSFSHLYKTQTVHGFYTDNAASYKNPHEPGIRKCLHSILEAAFDTIKPADEDDKEPLGVLDVAAGGGEATMAVGQWVAEHKKGIRIRPLGMDPYTYELFQQKTRARALPWGFREILEGKLLEPIPSPAAVMAAMELAREEARQAAIRAAKQAEKEARRAARQAAIDAAIERGEAIDEEAELSEDSDDEELEKPQQEKTQENTNAISQPQVDDEPPKPAPIFHVAIISFALHLVAQEELYQTLNMLSQSCRYMIILAPNRGHLERVEERTGWNLVPDYEMNVAKGSKTFDGKWFWSRDSRGERVGGGLWKSWNLE